MAWKSFCGLRSLPALAALLCLPYSYAQFAQTSAGHMTVGDPQKIAGKRNQAVQSRIACTVRPGFHVNSNTPSDEYLIPLKITWTSTGALQPAPVTFPKPVMEKYLDKPISVFTGKFELIANFKVAPNAPAGPGIAAGRLRYQACNDRACYPPKTIEISIPYQIQ